jgi:hypothetical protein
VRLYLFISGGGGVCGSRGQNVKCKQITDDDVEVEGRVVSCALSGGGHKEWGQYG